MNLYKLFLILLLISFNTLLAKSDIILLRNGNEITANVNLINDDYVTYQISKRANVQSIPTKDVYMVKFDSRGNIYINDDGLRITGEKREIPKGVDVVYLVDYKEIPAYNLNVTSSKISFLTHKPNKKIIPLPDAVYQRDEVFKIRYSDGTMDVITSLDKDKMLPVEKQDSNKSLEPQYQVIFHIVGKKERIKDIAEKYNVEVHDIMEWNDIPSETSPNSVLTPNSQLIIYLRMAD